MKLKAALDSFDAESLLTATSFEGTESMAQQQFKEECDINEIVRRFGLSGKMPEEPRIGEYGDFTGLKSFSDVMQYLRGAEEAFMEFPGDVRARFGNDPGAMLLFLQDEKNRDEALRLGLLKPPPEVTRDAVKAIDELAAKLSPPKAAV